MKSAHIKFTNVVNWKCFPSHSHFPWCSGSMKVGSWSPKVSEKALRTRPRPGDGSGNLLCARDTGVGTLLWSMVDLYNPLSGKGTVHQKSLSALPGASSCWTNCTDLTPSSPPRLPDPQADAETPIQGNSQVWPLWGSRNPPLIHHSAVTWPL